MSVKNWSTSRRVFIQGALQGIGAMMMGCGADQERFAACGGDASMGGAPTGEGTEEGAFPHFGPLGAPDEHGIRLPAGYRARLLATSGELVGSSKFSWHHLPDGGACFSPPGLDGHIYVSNAEVGDGRGGVSGLVFSREGDLVDAYSIATGLDRPCQGGATPWGTWLSCEEVELGRVIECDPLGRAPQHQRLAMGRFNHEGLSYDVRHHHIYLTEDEPDGALYRFVPARVVGGRAELSAGKLQVARHSGHDQLDWVAVPDATVSRGTPTRYQVPDAARFDGGEGVWCQDGSVVFTTKGDDRVWSYDTNSGRLRVLYDRTLAACPLLSGVDQIVGTSSGELLVAEDGGNMQIVAISPTGRLRPLLRIEGQDWSEITGIAFSPDGQRLYFSSQRGGHKKSGQTYEISGPFGAAA